MLSLEMLLASRGLQGEKEEMDALWKEALLYQFHDILPGSSIARVYEETDAAYAEMFEKLERLARNQGVSYVPGADKKLLNLRGEKLHKLVRNGDRYFLYQGSDAAIAPVCYENGIVTDGCKTVETDYYTATFAQDGSFQNICLKNGQVIVENANRLQVFMDVMDAWDFEDDYRDQPEVLCSWTAPRCAGLAI